MDFTFTPEQDEAAELAARILKDRATNERMKQVEAGGDRFDPELWAELGSAGLLGLALPEEYDGAGLGLIELCRVLVEVGRTVAPVPLVAHGAAGRLIAEQGSRGPEAGLAARCRLGCASAHRSRGRGPRTAAAPSRDDRGADRRRLDPDRGEDAGPDRDAGGPLPGHGDDTVGLGRLPRRAGHRRRDRASPAHQRQGPRRPGRARQRARASRSGTPERPSASATCWSWPPAPSSSGSPRARSR